MALAVLQALIVLGVVLAVVLVILYSGYLRFTDLAADPPEVDEAALDVDRSGRRITYGESWLARRGGLWEMHLVGSPAAIGDAHGQLAARLFHRLDADLRRLIDGRYPTWMDGWSALVGVRWDFRQADAALPRRSPASSPPSRPPSPRPPASASAATTASSSTSASSSSAPASTTCSSRGSPSPRCRGARPRPARAAT
ncbi:MAG: hypothetical protein H6710_04220 [Myxococcales bacterium]|nr:hypothetical protein [Myxococcales bacterium]